MVPLIPNFTFPSQPSSFPLNLPVSLAIFPFPSLLFPFPTFPLSTFYLLSSLSTSLPIFRPSPPIPFVLLLPFPFYFPFFPFSFSFPFSFFSLFFVPFSFPSPPLGSFGGKEFYTPLNPSQNDSERKMILKYLDYYEV